MKRLEGNSALISGSAGGRSQAVAEADRCESAKVAIADIDLAATG